MSRRILDETTKSTFSSDDYLYMDGQTDGSSKITPDNLVRNTTVAQQLAQHIADAEDEVEQITSDIEDIQTDLNDVKSDIGDLEDLETTDKSSLVGAINEARGSGGDGLTADVKQALLDCFENVAWINDDGQSYYDALEDALYPPANLVSISAVYTQGGTVYDTDTLDSLKTDLVVTAHYDDSSTQTVTTYTLSGTLTEGTSTITVAYGGKTDTFSVMVTEAPEVALYPLPDITYSASDNAITVTDGNHIAGHSVQNSRKYCISSDGTVTSYHVLTKPVIFTLAEDDTYELKVKNISFSENAVATNYIRIGIVDNASSENYVFNEQVSLTTTSEASGTLADVTVTGTVNANANVNAVIICPYRSVTFTFDVELRINGTRYI